MDSMNSFKTWNAIATKINPRKVGKFPLTDFFYYSAFIIIFLIKDIVQNLMVSPSHSSIKSWYKFILNFFQSPLAAMEPSCTYAGLYWLQALLDAWGERNCGMHLNKFILYH